MKPHRRSSAHGLALIAVLWIVAALSLLALGATATVYQQIQVATTERDRIAGQALGEGAIALALQQMQASPERVQGVTTVEIDYAGVPVAVEVAPLNGLISLGGAKPELFAALLHVAGGLPQGQAQALAEEIVAWRDGRPELDITADAAARSQPRGFEAPEDLMLVPGIDYGLYARIAPLVTADLGSAAGVDPQSAPPEVLAVLAGGDAAQVARYVAQRGAGGTPADASGFNRSLVAGGSGNIYRLRADVPLDGGKILALTQDVALGANFSPIAPWRVLRTERRIVPPAG